MANQAYFGGGCFWCTEAVFKQFKGVEAVVSGYAGGAYPNPSYDDLHRLDTGHAEVVKVTYNPAVITYEELLEIFFASHDPTTLNRQGNDAGPEYRSIILYSDDAQKAAAQTALRDLAPRLWSDPVVTELKPLQEFWPAEESHQDYFNKNPVNPYCIAIINPKLAKIRQKFANRLK